MIPTVVLANHSSVSLPWPLETLAQAMREYLAVLGPVWGRRAEVSLGGSQVYYVTPGLYFLELEDWTDEAGALAYHTLASGSPYGVSFLKTEQQYGMDLSVPVLHELAEMIVDPHCNACFPGQDGIYRSLEVCDPVQELLFKLPCGLLAPNFVFPTWFGLPDPAGVDFRHDYLGFLSRPGQLAPGGYIGIWTEQNGWQYQTADGKGQVTVSDKLGLRTSRLARRKVA